MTLNVRRIVTGHDSSGKAIVASDERMTGASAAGRGGISRCELWSADKPTFKGRFVTFEGAYCRPQPVNKSVPIIVGGHSEPAARRAGRLGDGYFPARGAPV